MKARIKFPIILMVVFALGIFSGVVLTSKLHLSEEAKAQPGIVDENGESPFVKVAKEIMPTVVNISTERIIKNPTEGFQFGEGPFDEFFKRFFEQFHPPIPEKERSLGSGFIFKRDGDYYYIMTNNHVVRNADKIIVKLSDKTVITGDDVKVVGRDPLTDIAVVKIKAPGEDLPVAKLGDSDKIQVGDWAIAVGNPFGFDRTVTVGVISAKGRSGLNIPQGPIYQNFIQTDAAINPGNSGGPLVNIKGEVIGVNSAITSPSGGFVGIGFAIPINLAKHIAEQLIEKGKIERGYLGIWPQSLTPELAKAYGLKKPEGVLVAKVEKDTPAEKAGLKEGDVIIEFNGKKVTDVESFRLMVAETPPGTKVEIKVIGEDGKERTLYAKLAKYPQEVLAQAGGENQESEIVQGKASWLGMTVVDVKSDDAQKLGIKADKGVVVIKVDPEGKASDAGVQIGDIILKIGKIEITNLEDFVKAKKVYKDSEKPVIIKLSRRGIPRFIAITPK